CQYCGIPRFTSETPGFCCGRQGSKAAQYQPLPPYPDYMALVLDDPNSHDSRKLNLIFSFVAIQTSGPFPNNNVPLSFFAVQGRVYHQHRATHNDSALRWYLLDGAEEAMRPFPNFHLPAFWIQAVQRMMLSINPFAIRFIH
ncbi:hypothetical protein TREMEDRAFT_19209, partial [Tremella mesenterica DSM 1558]|uniref:uncharacterized protein n=1 Tax=Tremella mesenterica (strain ATCC 24925 / CBS 8224 / DSM 1558 / NBRC 9311 / NRRL Y-6157 / RJB 2259-6 / UBC 559-6) TaxID=578456 RepID=UPI00032D4B70